MRTPRSVERLEEFGRIQLSPNFFMREFLYSEVAAIYGIPNVPDNPDLAVEVGKQLCLTLLEPLQEAFGRVTIRSAFRSQLVNARCNEEGKGCARNKANYAGHIWDIPNERGKGATACVVVPSFADRFSAAGDWKRLAWWIHDHLPYSEMEFYPVRWAFNLSWHENPVRSISSQIPGNKGYLTRVGMPGHDDDHSPIWQEIAPSSYSR